MFLEIDETNKGAYGFKFQEPTELDKIATIFGIGCESRTLKYGYYWDCQLRTDTETFIFQYTLSGRGEIKIKGKTYQLSQRSAFIVTVPEDCEYYLPPSSKEWKFIYITLKGAEAKKCWEYINLHHGYIFEIPIEKMVIQQLLATYSKVREGRITDAYHASNKAYEFLTFCYRHFETDHASSDTKLSQDVASAVNFIKKHYCSAINVLDIAEHVGLSKSYLNKKFKQQMGIPPVNYLNKYRIEEAIYLLQHTMKSVKDVSFELGFSDPNYFCKAFRKATGISPNMFRKNKDSYHSFDFLITDHHGIIELD